MLNIRTEKITHFYSLQTLLRIAAGNKNILNFDIKIKKPSINTMLIR